MKKIVLLFISMMVLTGCGKVDKDSLVKDFRDKVSESKSYVTESIMEIYNSEDTFTYNISVAYMDDDYFKVKMVNTMNNHEQIILRNNEEVYVVTPSLNKSYRFVSEWPYNSSQSYILNTLVKDIEESSEVVFLEESEGYSLTVDVNYPNNAHFIYEKIYFDKDKNIKSVDVYDNSDVVAINVKFTKVDYKANLSEKDFNVEEVVDSNCCNIDEDDNNSSNGSDNSNSSNTDNKDNKENGMNSSESGNFDDIIYPLYVPANTFLKNKEMINTENGDRAILTFNGDKNFILIEEAANVSDEFEVISVYGDPTMLNNTIGALSSNSLSWTVDNVDYYLASNDLSTTELLTIADSMSASALVVEK